MKATDKTRVTLFVIVVLVLFAVVCDIVRAGGKHIAKRAHQLHQAEEQAK